MIKKGDRVQVTYGVAVRFGTVTSLAGNIGVILDGNTSPSFFLRHELKVVTTSLAQVGDRVKINNGREGIVTSSNSTMIRVELDGCTTTDPYHHHQYEIIELCKDFPKLQLDGMVKFHTSKNRYGTIKVVTVVDGVTYYIVRWADDDLGLYTRGQLEYVPPPPTKDDLFHPCPKHKNELTMLTMTPRLGQRICAACGLDILLR